MRKYYPIHEEAVSHIWLCNCSIPNFLIYEDNLIFLFIGEWKNKSKGNALLFALSRSEYRTIYRGSGFLAVVCCGSTPTLPSLLPESSTGETQEDWERVAICWREMGEGDGRGAATYEGKKAWPSINHSILSDPVSLYDQIKWIATSLFSLSLSPLCGPYRSFASLTVACMGHIEALPL
jgi:hypothetical protein